jgi:hypothetical protein
MNLEQQHLNPQRQQAPARLNRAQAAEYCNVSPRTLERLAWLRRGPPYMKLGRRTFYRMDALEQWLISREDNNAESK